MLCVGYELKWFNVDSTSLQLLLKLRILTHDELPDSVDVQVQLMALSANWGIFDRNQIRKAREAGVPTPDYLAVYAVESDEVLAKVNAFHFDIETINGPETMTGITGVLTRRDKSRQGLSRQLFLDVHRREKESGIRHLILWTQRHNKAHILYESLGYRNVYGPMVAIVKLKGQQQQTQDITIKIRDATSQDVHTIDNLHSKLTRGRLGFSHRYKDFWNLWINILGTDKASDFKLFTRNDEPVGYSLFQKNAGWASSYEVIVEPQYSEQAIKLLEQEAKGNWLALGDSFVVDNRSLLTKRGYALANYSYTTLMGMSLGDLNEDMVKLLGSDNAKFMCHYGDHF